MRLIKVSHLIAFMYAMLIALTSCSSDSDKAGKVISNLTNSDCVLSVNLIDGSKRVITAEMQKDSTVTVFVYNLETETMDSIVNFAKNSKVWDVVPLKENNYLVVTSLPREDGKDHHLFFAHLLRNIHNKKTSSITALLVDDNVPELAATGYTLDKDSQKLTLSSYNSDSSSATIYHTVYDFNGNRLVSDPVKFNLHNPTARQSESTATYLWECQKCHLKRSASKKPTMWEYGCDGNRGGVHSWEKIGRID